MGIEHRIQNLILAQQGEELRWLAVADDFGPLAGLGGRLRPGLSTTILPVALAAEQAKETVSTIVRNGVLWSQEDGQDGLGLDKFFGTVGRHAEEARKLPARGQVEVATLQPAPGHHHSFAFADAYQDAYGHRLPHRSWGRLLPYAIAATRCLDGYLSDR